MKLYIDTEYRDINEGSGRNVVRVFGPFTSRETAEEALVAITAREDVMGAIVRNPNPEDETLE